MTKISEESMIENMKKIAIIGGGAAGMICALRLAAYGFGVEIFERGERLGRKLSATGNGQGNLTNLNLSADRYFSDDPAAVEGALSRYGAGEFISFLETLGGIFLPDERGRVYPASRQASAITDLLRRELMRLGVEVRLGAYVEKLTCEKGGFILYAAGEQVRADAVVLCTGGKAAENFGTDGSAFALAKSFGHSVTELRPALVALRCKETIVRSLKGIRTDGLVRVVRGKEIYKSRGDVLFTDTGVSGDAVFRASSYAKEGDKLLIDLLPAVSEERLEKALSTARGEDCLLCVVNNGLGRALWKEAGGDKKKLIALIKNFPLTVSGTLGFARAQVTRGGIPLKETDAHFMSKKRAGLYFAGEALNVDGECGGYNLQWAFTSASIVAEGIHEADAQ